MPHRNRGEIWIQNESTKNHAQNPTRFVFATGANVLVCLVQIEKGVSEQFPAQEWLWRRGETRGRMINMWNVKIIRAEIVELIDFDVSFALALLLIDDDDDNTRRRSCARCTLANVMDDQGWNIRSGWGEKRYCINDVVVFTHLIAGDYLNQCPCRVSGALNHVPLPRWPCCCWAVVSARTHWPDSGGALSLPPCRMQKGGSLSLK